MNSRAPPATILIVDDEPRNCRLLRTLLQPEGYLTRIATSGEEALDSIAQQAPDLILLDIMMPGMDGYKVASTLKADPATSNIPIIIVTQRTDRDAHLAGLNAGAEEFLMKPVDRAELWLRIRNLLRLKTLGDFSRNHGAILEEQVQARTAELQRFRAAMQISGDGIVLVDRARMRYIDVNQTICSMIGHTREELLAMTPMDLFGAERAVLERDYDALIADNNSGANLVEGHCRHKDGSRIPVETRRRALHTGDGWLIVGTVRDVTAGKKVAQELRESEQRLRTIIETEPECVKVVNAEMLLVEMNPAGLAMLEAGSLAEAQAQSLISFIVFEYRAAFADLHARVMRGESGNLEFEVIGLKGGRRWLETHAAPLGGTNSKAAMLLGVTRDITARKRSAEALSRFSTAMDATADAIYLVDRSSMAFVHVNEAACRMQGKPRAELLALGPEGVLEIPRAELERIYDSVIAGGVAAEPLEMLRTRRDGSQAWVELRRHAQRSGDGWTIVTLVRDITDRKSAALELLESERRFSDVLSNIELLSLMLDTNACVTYCNDYLLRLTGWRREEIMGRSWFEVFKPVGARMEGFAALLANLPEAWHREYEIHTRSGERRLIRWNNSVLRSGAGAVIGTASIGEDITEQKSAEVKISRLNRVYAMLSGINSAIVRIPEREALFREVCRIAVADGGFFLARIVEVDLNGKARIAATTESDTRLFQGIVEEYNGDPANSGSMLALALRSEQPLISNDVAGDLRIPHRAALTKDGNYALALLPIIVERRIVGTIILRSRVAGLFDEDELHLLLELISNLSFALEHMDKEARIRRLTRVYAVLSGINGLIVRVRDRGELFKQACRIAVEQGRFRLAWIGLVDRIEMKLVPVESAGSTEDLVALFNQGFSLAEDEPTGNSFSAQAIREKKASVCNDVQNDPRILFKDQHAKRGSRSMVILPLQIGGEVMGLLALYSEETGFFDDEELKLLSELAGDIAFAVDHIDKRDRLDYLAYYDELTGLANRSLYLERVAQYIRNATAGAHQLALFFIDLERFRNINDSLGRPAGDALLKLVSAWLSRTVGDPSLLARLGADHFAVVLPKLKQDGNVASLIDKSIQALLDHSFHLNHTEFRIAAKVGVALFPADGADAETLLRNAEVALKKAKSRGERYVFYKPKMTESVAGKLSLETQLRQALDNEEFVLHYQPKLNLESRTLTGAEALIRWNDPRTGLVPPGRFIPVLEETGLIMDVGRWALRKAIADYLRWRAAGLPAVRIAVNVSPLQLRHRGFTGEIEQVLGIHAAAAAGLELEITENLIMDDVKHNIASLQAIRALGVTIAIDDFGTGFSSLSYLARLPVDTLKIDRSFVIDMTTGPQGLALIPAIINLAHSLKLKVVAEGVETEEQSRLLRLLRCDEMQGFLLSKPVPVEIFEAKFLAPAPASAAA